MDFVPRQRIGGGTKMFMLLVATALWLLGLIPFVDWITDPVSWFIFWIWFKLCGASISKNKVLNIASGVVSLFPTIGAFLGAFPVVVYINIRRVKREDNMFNARALAEAEEANAIRQQEYSDYLSAQRSINQEMAEEEMAA